ncbi:hypothetical protein SKAU_G00215940 [Synaphobranchus kaupii]|uniref:Uncharacterized protein n=1 Tax=Synaphobranchus kaupii TaxID=118154 RepID=A0A9Q1FA10_SYNKA|nr:hypothetical protein SKAU_G00215940 [Synaphobranchus kaupii]
MYTAKQRLVKIREPADGTQKAPLPTLEEEENLPLIYPWPIRPGPHLPPRCQHSPRAAVSSRTPPPPPSLLPPSPCHAASLDAPLPAPPDAGGVSIVRQTLSRLATLLRGSLPGFRSGGRFPAQRSWIKVTLGQRQQIMNYGRADTGAFFLRLSANNKGRGAGR